MSIEHGETIDLRFATRAVQVRRRKTRGDDARTSEWWDVWAKMGGVVGGDGRNLGWTSARWKAADAFNVLLLFVPERQAAEWRDQR